MSSRRKRKAQWFLSFLILVRVSSSTRMKIACLIIAKRKVKNLSFVIPIELVSEYLFDEEKENEEIRRREEIKVFALMIWLYSISSYSFDLSWWTWISTWLKCSLSHQITCRFNAEMMPEGHCRIRSRSFSALISIEMIQVSFARTTVKICSSQMSKLDKSI